ncbi:MAG: response regulator [Oligoflexales bacterium]|nr:response regulator [Oligoflexales bacterium]
MRIPKILLTTILAFSHTTKAADAIVIEPKGTEYQIGENVDYFEDIPGKITIDEAASSSMDEKWIKSKVSVPNFGFTPSVYWLRFTIDSEKISQNNKDWLLEISYPALDLIELYIPGPDGKFEMKDTGDHFPFSHREIENHNFLFSMQLSGKQTFYLKCATTGSMKIPMKLWESNKFNVKNNREVLGFGFFCGVIIVMMLYNAFLSITIRDINYIYYIGYIGLFLGFNMSLQGIAYQYLWPNNIWIGNYSIPICMYGSATFALFFSRSFLQTPKLTPYLNKLITLLIAWGILGLAAVPFLSYKLTTAASTSLSFCLNVVLMTAGFVLLKRGYRSARFYLIAFAAMWIGMASKALQTLGIIPVNFITESGITIGSVAEVILLSLALGDKIRHEQMKAQKEIEDLNANLIEKEKARTTFFHNTSHELRTPLNGIIAFVSLLLKQQYGNLPERANIQLSKIGNLAGSLMTQVNAILDLAKSRKGELKLLNSAIPLNEIVDETNILAEGLRLKKPNIDFVCKTSWKSSESPSFINDREKILTIIRNLIGNAFKFSQVDRKNQIVLELVHVDGNSLTIKVEDRGIGIPKDLHEAIFEEFRQVQGDSRRVYEGTGLGLTMVRAIVSLMEGKIDLASEIGQGSTFTVFIPAQKEIHLTQSEPKGEFSKVKIPDPDESDSRSVLKDVKDAESKDQKKRKILVIDDNEINCEVVMDILGSAGHQVISSLDGKSGLAKIREDKPDLIILDLMMPEFSGEDVLNELKKDDLLRDIPVILLTARASQEDRIFGLSLGADDYLAKPIISRELMHRVHNLVERLEFAKLMETNVYEQKMAQLGSLMSDLAHELRNINNSAAYNVDNLKPKIINLLKQFPLPEPGWSEIIKSITEASRALTRPDIEDKINSMNTSDSPVTNELSVIATILTEYKCEEKNLMEIWKYLVSSKDYEMIRRLDGCLDIVSDLLTFSRSVFRTNELMENVLNYGRKSISHDQVDITSLIAQAMSFMSFRFKKAGVALKTSLDFSGKAAVDSSDMQQILVNLLVNSCDALSGVRKDGSYIEIRTREIKDRVFVQVADNGCGIQPEIMEKIFESNFTTKGNKGNGRGLFLAKRLMHKNKGDISVNCSNGETVFTLEMKKAA